MTMLPRGSVLLAPIQVPESIRTIYLADPDSSSSVSDLVSDLPRLRDTKSPGPKPSLARRLCLTAY